MRRKMKLYIDFAMMIALLLLMAYSLIGEATHEWLGIGMFALLVAHNLLNINWYRSLLRGKYTALRICWCTVNMLVLFCMIGLMVSGVMLSRYAFSFLPSIGGSHVARTLHMLCAYWFFVLMSVHIGMHIGTIMTAMRKKQASPHSQKVHTLIPRIMVVLLCIYGVYAFAKRQLASYMTLQTMFVFFDFNEPVLFFFVDYIAIMGLFICVGNCVANVFKGHQQRVSSS